MCECVCVPAVRIFGVLPPMPTPRHQPTSRHHQTAHISRRRHSYAPAHTHTLTHQHYNAPETPAIRKSTWVRRLSVCVCFTLFRFRGTFWCAGSLKSSPPPPLPSSSLLRTTHAACRHLAEPPPRCRVGRLNKHQITHMAGAGRRRRSQ